MIWLSTTKFGIGEAGQASGKYFFVTSYFPPVIFDAESQKKNLRRLSKLLRLFKHDGKFTD